MRRGKSSIALITAGLIASTAAAVLAQTGGGPAPQCLTTEPFWSCSELWSDPDAGTCDDEIIINDACSRTTAAPSGYDEALPASPTYGHCVWRVKYFDAELNDCVLASETSGAFTVCMVAGGKPCSFP